MAMPEHVETARRITLRCLKRQRGILFSRHHIDAGLALSKRINQLERASENDPQAGIRRR